MGSHTSYKKRYPKGFDHFPFDSSREKVIAQYDNSVLYNDYVVDSLFQILSEYSNQQTQSINSAIYLSDHGENVYDEMDKLGHDFAGVLPKSNVDIPFVLWLPNNDKVNSILRGSELNNMRNRPFVSDDLFHAILGLNGIKSPYINNKRSVFDLSYNDLRQRVLTDGHDYDIQ